MRAGRWISWTFVVIVAFAPSVRAQEFSDEILFGIEYAIYPEFVTREGTAFGFPRTIDRANIVIGLRNPTLAPMEGPLSFTVRIDSGPWIFSPFSAPPGLFCSGSDRQMTCQGDPIVLPSGEVIRITAPIVCPVFSTETGRFSIFGPEVPDGGFSITQHNNPLITVAGWDDLDFSDALGGVTFTENFWFRNSGPTFTGRVNTILTVGNGTGTVIQPPTGDPWGGVAPCPPGGLVQSCPAPSFTVTRDEIYQIQWAVSTRLGVNRPSVLVSMSFPDNADKPPFNVGHVVDAAANGPDPVPFIAGGPGGTVRAGEKLVVSPYVLNAGLVETQGSILGSFTFGAGVSMHAGLPLFSIHSTVAPADRAFVSAFIAVVEGAGPSSLEMTISGGGDVRTDNNRKRTEFVIVPPDPDPLARAAEDLGRILDGR